MGALKALALIVVVLLFAANFTVLATLFAVQGTFLQADFYESQLEQAGAYPAVKGMAADMLAGQVGASIGGAVAEQEIKEIIGESIPEQLIKQETQKIVRGLFSYLNGESSIFTATISVAQIKENLAENVAERVVAGVGGGGLISKEKFKQQLLGQISVPNEIELVKSTPKQLKQARQIIGILKSITTTSIAVAIILLMIIAALTFRALQQLKKWFFITFLLAGIGAIAAGVVLATAVQGLVMQQKLPEAAAELIKGFVASALAELAGTMLLFGAAAIVVGIVFLALHVVGKGKHKMGKMPEYTQLKLKEKPKPKTQKGQKHKFPQIMPKTQKILKKRKKRKKR